MLNIFTKKDRTVECKFCNKVIDKSSTFVLQYKAVDAIGSMDVCIECSNILNDIINVRDSLYEEDE